MLALVCALLRMLADMPETERKAFISKLEYHGAAAPLGATELLSMEDTLLDTELLLDDEDRGEG